MEMPLFPLNSVLFPGMPLKLYIFEERYKMMINECIDTQTPFGVVLIEEGDAEHGPLATPYTVGTTAYITQVQKLAFGRMNILAIGRERFKVNQLYNDRPYLYADVDLIPLGNDNDSAARKGSQLLRPLIERYLTMQEEAGRLQFDSSQIPREPIALAFLGAILLQTEDSQKQGLLESENTTMLLRSLISIYQREVKLQEVLLAPPDHLDDDERPFSLN